MTFREAMNARFEIKRYQWFAILATLTTMWSGGIYGVFRYYEEHEQLRCEQRAETSNKIRSAFFDVFDLIDATTSSPVAVITQARAVLLVDFPIIDPEKC